MLFDGIDDGSSDRSKALRNAVKQVTDPMILNELMNTPTILSMEQPQKERSSPNSAAQSSDFDDGASPAAAEPEMAPISQQPKNLLQSKAKVGGKKHKELVVESKQPAAVGGKSEATADAEGHRQPPNRSKRQNLAAVQQ